MSSLLFRMKRLWQLVLPCLLSLASHAQTTTLSGTVRDGRGHGLPGVNVFR